MALHVYQPVQSHQSDKRVSQVVRPVTHIQMVQRVLPHVQAYLLAPRVFWRARQQLCTVRGQPVSPCVRQHSHTMGRVYHRVQRLLLM